MAQRSAAGWLVSRGTGYEVHGKSTTAYARERTTIGDHPAAVRQLKSEVV